MVLCDDTFSRFNYRQGFLTAMANGDSLLRDTRLLTGTLSCFDILVADYRDFQARNRLRLGKKRCSIRTSTNQSGIYPFVSSLLKKVFVYHGIAPCPKKKVGFCPGLIQPN
jgi:hypothetical protein